VSVPPELLAQLGVSGAQGPPGYAADQTGGQGGQGGDPLTVLQECIQSLPGVIAALPDPRDTQDATRALLLLTGIQTRMMSQQGGGGQQQGAGGPSGYGG
jgi:hypothetical protein